MSRALFTWLLSGLVTLAAGTSHATIHQINVGNFFFSPTKTTVSPGDTVRWVLISGFHTTRSEANSPKQWDSPTLMAGNPFQVIFTEADGPGPFPYYCEFHPFDMKDTIFMNLPPADPIYFPFLLNEAAAANCSGTGSSARGWGLATLSPDSSQLTVYVEHNVPSPIDGHVHLGAPCTSGPIVFPFSSFTSPIDETFNITPAQVTELLAGNYYVNIHTAAFPSGEIQGQIAQDPIKFIFTLDESQAAAGTGTGSLRSGFAVCELAGDALSMTIDITHDIPNDSVTDGHLHLGAPGINGSIQFPFTQFTSPISEVWSDMDTTDVKNLLRGDLYVNVHTIAFPSEEIRGQIARQPVRWAMPMSGPESGNASTATGFGVLELNDQLTELSIYVEHNVANVTDGHIHFGAIGVNGSIQFPFSSFTSPISETWELDDGDLDNLLNDLLYINIHSMAFPSGEIRGQIDHESVGFSFNLDEAQANSCLGTGSPATGTATLALKAGGRELTLKGTHNVAGPTDAHVHLGALCVEGGIVYPFSSPTSPFKEPWYLDLDDIVNLMQQELYVNIHSGSFPSGEIRGQLAVLTCCVVRGDVNHNGTLNVADLTYLVNRLFKGGPAPSCAEEGNVNNDAGNTINVADLTFLVNRLFKGGPSPAACD